MMYDIKFDSVRAQLSTCSAALPCINQIKIINLFGRSTALVNILQAFSQFVISPNEDYYYLFVDVDMAETVFNV